MGTLAKLGMVVLVLALLAPGVMAAEPGSLRAERLAKLAAFEAERQAHYAE